MLGVSSKTEAFNIEYTSFDSSNLPYISGSGALCSGTSLTVNNVPPGASITWSTCCGVSLSSAQGSNPCTFNVNDDCGNQEIQATITNVCGNSVTCNKTFWVGIPPLPEVTSDNLYPYIWTTGYGEPAAKKYTILTEQDIVVYDGNLDTYGGLIESFDWTWYLDDMGLFYDEYDHGTGGKMYIFHEPGLFRVRATSTNNCGSTSISNPIYIDVIQDEYWLSLSPNPSSGTTIIQIKSTLLSH